MKCLLKNERRRADRLQQELNDRTIPRLVDAESINEEREQIYNEHYRKECRRLVNWVHHDTARIQLLHSAFAGQIPIQFQDLEMRHGITTRNIALDNSGVLDEYFCLDYIASAPRGEVHDLRRSNIQLNKLLAVAEKSLLASCEVTIKMQDQYEERLIKESLKIKSLNSEIDNQKTEIKSLKDAMNRKPRKRKFYDMDKAKERIDECEKRIKLITCPICMENNVNKVFACGHVVCSECCSKLKQKTYYDCNGQETSKRATECPICKTTSVAVDLHLG